MVIIESCLEWMAEQPCEFLRVMIGAAGKHPNKDGDTPAVHVIGREPLTQHYHEREPALVSVSKFCLNRKA